MIPLGALAGTVITILVAGLVWWLLWWLIGYCGVPEPFNRVARVVLAICAVVFLIFLLIGLTTGQPLFRP